jgi:hypothetical protein
LPNQTEIDPLLQMAVTLNAHQNAAAKSKRRTDVGTLIVLDHRGFPDGEYDNLYTGWNEHYWEPLMKFLD